MPFISSVRGTYGAQGQRNRASRRRIAATGGSSVSDITVSGKNYRVHRFNSGGTFTVSDAGVGSDVKLDVIIVAGGGSGGGDSGGGGGGGGLIDTQVTPTATSYSITVGDGGPLRTGAENDGPGRGGLNSTGFGLTALGGGAGSGWQNTSAPSQGGYNGGSGGGQGTASNTAGGTASVNSNRGLATQPGSASGGFGNDGGFAVNSYASGGGGAGAAGGNASGGGTSGTPGIGGIGYLLNGRFGSGIGISDRLAPGGTGGYESSYSVTNPGSNNGAAFVVGAAPANSSPANTGGGGNGSNHNDNNSGAGGSGIVLIRYELF